MVYIKKFHCYLLNAIKNFKIKSILIALLITLLIISLAYNTPIKTYRKIKVSLINDIYCYRTKNLPTLPDILNDDPPKGKSIFFHETSCHSFENNRITITSRQACAVESAAILNPNFQVYLLFTSPGLLKFENDRNDRILKQLAAYHNIKMKYLNFGRYLDGTPLEDLYKSQKIESSLYAMSHASDVLRYLTLWRFGGIYLDLDVILMKSLEKLKPNFAGRESGHAVAAGVLSFSHDGDGHKWATQCLEDLKKNFNGSNWSFNGPGVITRLLTNLCGNIEVKNMTREKCKGFSVYPPSAFYPIPWRKWKYYFNRNCLRYVLHSINNTIAIHVWNKHSVNKTIRTGSDVPYEFLARKYCPKVYAASGDEF